MKPRRFQIDTQAASRGDGGYTLIELVVVLAILAAGAALSFPRLSGTNARATVQSTAQLLATELRATRNAARVSNTTQSLTFNVASHTYQSSAAARARALPPRLTASLDPSGDAIVFLPDGSSSGGVITVSDGRQAATVAVDWMTGRTVVK